MKTAKEFLEEEDSISYGNSEDNSVAIDSKTVKKLMIKFAKQHVKAALKTASKKAECCADAIVDLGHTITEAYVEKDSILNAYPLTNIK